MNGRPSHAKADLLPRVVGGALCATDYRGNRRSCRAALIALAAAILLTCARDVPPSETVPSLETWEVDALPEGNASQGREAFLTHHCYACHRVAGDEQLPPMADYIDADLGPVLQPTPAEELAMAIISRTHLPRASRAFEGGPPPMGTLSERLTVAELIDIVAYLRQPPAAPKNE